MDYHVIISKLKEFAEKMEGLGDLDKSAMVLSDVDKLEAWIQSGQVGECPVDLSAYEVGFNLQEESSSAEIGEEQQPAEAPSVEVEQAVKTAETVLLEPAEQKEDALSGTGTEEAESLEEFAELDTPEKMALRRQLDQARNFQRKGQLTEAVALFSELAARAEGDIKVSAKDLLEQATRQLNSQYDEQIAAGKRAQIAGIFDEARKHFENARHLKPDEDLPKRALLELGGALATQISDARLLALRSGLKERRDLSRLGEAVYEAEALDGEGKLPEELILLLKEARQNYDLIRKSHGNETTQMRFGDLSARADAVKKIRDRVSTGERLIYDSTTNTERPAFELLQEANKLLEQASEDLATYELDLAEKNKDAHPRYALSRLQNALKQPLAENYLRLLEEKVTEIEAWVNIQEKAESLQEKAQNETDLVKSFSLILQAQKTFPRLPGIEEQVTQKRQIAQNALAVQMETLLRDAEIALTAALKNGDFKAVRAHIQDAEEAAAAWPEETKPVEISTILERAAGLRDRVVDTEKNWHEYSELAASVRSQVIDSSRRAAALDLFRKISEDDRFKAFPDLAILTSEIDNYTDVGEKLVNAQAARSESDWERVFDLADKAIKSGKAGKLADQFTALFEQASLELAISRAKSLLEDDDVFEANNVITAIQQKVRGTGREAEINQRLEAELAKITSCKEHSASMQAQYDRACDLVGLRDSLLLKAYVNPAYSLRQARIKSEGDVSNPEMRALIDRLKKNKTADPSAEELSALAQEFLLKELARKGVAERLEALRIFWYVGGDMTLASEQERKAWGLSWRTAEARRAGRLLVTSIREDVLPAMTKSYETREEKPISDTALLRLAENARGMREAGLLETDAEKDLGRWFEVEWGRRQSNNYEESGDWASAVAIWDHLRSIHPTPEVQNGWRRARIQQEVNAARDLILNHHDSEKAITLLEEIKGESGIGNSWEIEVALTDAYVALRNFPSAFGSLEEAVRYAPKDKAIHLAKKYKEVEREQEIHVTLEKVAQATTPLEKLRLIQDAFEKSTLKDSPQLKKARETIFSQAKDSLLAVAEEAKKTATDEGKLKAVMALVDLQALEELAEVPNPKRQSAKEIGRLRFDLASVADTVIRASLEFEPATMPLDQAISRCMEITGRLQTFETILPSFQTELAEYKDKLVKRRRETAKLLDNLKSLDSLLKQAMQEELWQAAIQFGNFQPLEQILLQIGALNLQAMPEVQNYEKQLQEWKDVRQIIMEEIEKIEKKFTLEEDFAEVGVLLTRLISLPKLRPDGQPWERINQQKYATIHSWMADFLRVNDLYSEGELIGWDTVGSVARERQEDLECWTAWDKECALKVEDMRLAGEVTAKHTPSTDLRVRKRDLENLIKAAQEAIDLLKAGPLVNSQVVPVNSKKSSIIQESNKKRLGAAESALREARLLLENVNQNPDSIFPTAEEFSDAVVQKDWDRLERLLERAQKAGTLDPQEQKQVTVYLKVLSDARQKQNRPNSIRDLLRGRKK